MGISNLSFSATNINVGLDANRSATPRAGDMYLATDTEFLYKCYTDDVWTSDELTEAKIDAAKANIAKVTTGSYPGNDGTNRAIAHGLGAIPAFVLIANDDNIIGFLYYGTGFSHAINTQGDVQGVYQTTTVMDATNFYVPASWLNVTGRTHYWKAIT